MTQMQIIKMQDFTAKLFYTVAVTNAYLVRMYGIYYAHVRIRMPLAITLISD